MKGKRFFSIVLALALILGICPVSTIAQDFRAVGSAKNLTVGASNSSATVHSSDDLVFGEDGSVNRAQWLHDLAYVFEMTIEDDNMPDNYFSDLSEEDEYYYDVMLAVEFGVVDVEAGDPVRPLDPATREFAAQTLNYCLGFQAETEAYTFSDADEVTAKADAQVAADRGWLALVDGAFLPSQSITETEARAMLTDAQTVLNNTVVTEGETTVTFADFVKQVPYGTEVELSLDGTTLTITGYDGTIAAGDVFSVFFDDMPAVYVAQSVTTENGVTTVAVREYDGDESAVLALELSGETLMDMDRFVPAEGFDAEVVTEIVPNSPNNAHARGLKKVSGYKTIKTIKGKLNFSLGSGVSMSGTADLSDMTLDYAASVSNRYAKAILYGRANITASLSVSTKGLESFPSSFTLGSAGIPGVASVSLTLDLEVSATLSYNFTGTFSVGVEYSGGSFRFIRNFNKESWSVSFELDGSITLHAGADVNVADVLKAHASARIGLEATYVSQQFSSGSPSKCETFRAWMFADVGVSASVKFLMFKKSFSKDHVFFSQKNSPVRVCFHKEDGELVDRCTRSDADRVHAKYTTGPSSRYGSLGGSSAVSGGSYGGVPYTTYEYDLDDDGNATITKYNGNASALSIPDTLDGHAVVGIGARAFMANSALRIVSIPDSVTTIEYEAFYKCLSLKNVILSKSLESLGGGAFANTAIQSIEIPRSLENCDWYGVDEAYTVNGNSYSIWYHGPFAGCERLTTASFESNTKKVAGNLFSGCVGLKKVSIPDTVTIIEEYAFRECVSLVSVTIPDSVTTIGSFAFHKCLSLKNVTLSKSLVSLGGMAFAYTKIENIEIPRSLVSCDVLGMGSGSTYDLDGSSVDLSGRYVGPFAFCEELKTISFEQGITNIPDNLFRACMGLENVVIPDTVTTIGTTAFCLCLRLKNVVISDSVTTIKDSAFSGCVSLENLTIPDSVTAIGWGAFSNCSLLESVTIPDSVTTIGDYAFSGCLLLKNVTLSKSLSTLGGCAFANTSIESIEIPKSLNSCGTCSTSWSFTYDYEGPSINMSQAYIGPFAFCEELKTIVFEEGITRIPSNLFSGCTGLESIELPDTMTEIGICAFKYCCRLKTVAIPDSVTTIESDAFSSCVSLPNVTIPDSVTALEGTSTFSNCTSLESVVLPKNIQSIAPIMFANCTSLKTIEIPSSVSLIRYHAFFGCSALESFGFENDETALKEIEQYAFCDCTSLKEAILPETVRTVGDYAFQNCTSLEKVYIPQSTKSLGSYAFQKDEALSDVTIADYSITKINDSTFRDCPALTSIVLPKGLTTVGNQAFMNDTALFDVTIPESVTSIASNALSYPNKTTIRGKTGSYAETFANDGGFTFVDISVPAEGLALVDGVEYVELEKGQSYRAEFEFFPDDANDVITLTSDKWFVGIEGLDLTANGTGDATVTATASSGTNYTFTLHVKGVRNIAVTTPPTKTEYELGEAFDPAGMVLTVNFTDNTTKTVTDFTVSGFDADTESEQTLRAEWIAADGYSYTTTFNVIVGHPLPPVTGIAITTPPTKLSYEKREALDLAGMVVTATYEDGTTREVTDYTVSGYNPLKTGTQTVTVKYESFTDTFTVEVGASSGHTVHDYSVLQSDGQYHWYKCSGCDLTTEKTAHSGGTATCESQAVCDVCGVSYGVLGDHSFEHVKENSTCAEQGFECDVCTVCLKSFDFINLPLAEHTWNSGTVTTPATCAAKGVKTFTCTVCNTTKTEAVAKNTSNHTGGTEVRNAKSATCSETGYTGDTYCKGCGAKLASGSVIPATGHTYGGWTEVKAATCTEKGSERRVCANDSSHIETREIAVLGHGETELRNANAATCTDAGYTGDTYCKVCGERIAEGTAIAALGHGETEVRNAKSATCTEAGYTGDTYCKVCNTKIADGAAVPALGHVDKDDDGVCDVCSTVLTTPEPPTQHTTEPGDETATQPSGDTTTLPADESTTQSSGETTTQPAGGTTTEPISDPISGQTTVPDDQSTTTQPDNTDNTEKPTIPDNIFENPDEVAVGSSENSGEIRYSSKVALTKSAVVASIVSFEGAVVTVKDKDGNELADDAAPGTGSTVTVAVGTVTVTKVLIFVGDVDGNGAVNASDARLALRAAAKLDVLEGAFASAADPDSSNTINATDARMILRAAAKLDDPAGWMK